MNHLRIPPTAVSRTRTVENNTPNTANTDLQGRPSAYCRTCKKKQSVVFIFFRYLPKPPKRSNQPWLAALYSTVHAVVCPIQVLDDPVAMIQSIYNWLNLGRIPKEVRWYDLPKIGAGIRVVIGERGERRGHVFQAPDGKPLTTRARRDKED